MKYTVANIFTDATFTVTTDEHDNLVTGCDYSSPDGPQGMAWVDTLTQERYGEPSVQGLMRETEMSFAWLPFEASGAVAGGDAAASVARPSDDDDDGIYRLEVDETDPDHPCTDASLYAPDLDLLAYMLQDLRSLLRANDAGKVDLIAHQPKFWEVHGMRRRIVVCEPERIRVRTRVCVVGFFGERRDADGERPLDELEVGLLREFRHYPGILSYSSIELANDYWSNLVVHNVPDDTDAWRGNAAHAHAVAVSPEIYASVRIHNGHLDDGVASSQAIVVDRTKYWDYRDEPAWHAMREFDPPMQRTRRQVSPRQPD